MRIAITGANAGIGLRATARLAAAGHDVIALCRSVDRGAAAVTAAGVDPARVDVRPLDLASRSSVQQAAAALVDDGPLDALIQNAAVFDQSMTSAQYTDEGHEVVWATNHLGAVELLARTSEALAASDAPRVVFVASKGLLAMPGIAIRFDALDSADWYTPTRAYYHAKLAQVMTAVSLAESAGDRVAVSCLRVPAVQLDADRVASQPALLRRLYALKRMASVPPEDVAAVYADLVLEDRRRAPDEVYVDEKRRPVALPRSARDADQRARLWAVTAEAIGDPQWAWPTVAAPAA